eukprot:gene8103-10974_t
MSLLSSDNEDKHNLSTKNHSLVYSFRMFGTVLGINDPIQVACIKAASYEEGLPKLKHINTLIQFIQEDDNNLMNIMINFSALVNWKESIISSCKILISIVIILQRCIKTSIYVGFDSILSLLHEMRDNISNNSFLNGLVLYLIQKIQMHLQLPNYCIHFNLNSTSSNGLSFAYTEDDNYSTVGSRILSSLEVLIRVMKIPLNYDFKSNNNINEEEYITCINSLGILIDDVQILYSAVKKCIEYIKQESSSPIMDLFVDQLSLQYIQIEEIINFMKSKSLFNENRPLIKFQQPTGL